MEEDFTTRIFRKWKDAIRLDLRLRCEMADQIPAEAHDIRMEYVMTEKRCWKC